jgi:peptidoglycan hydrolase-like protein with peptidoglycan-binding domain
MALRSQLFQGDAALEAAAGKDSAHVTKGAKGPHVGKIQLALIVLDNAGIANDHVYGPATAAAVLAYKKKRNIINRTYQQQPDDIVGKMTMASLDAEICAKEALLGARTRLEAMAGSRRLVQNPRAIRDIPLELVSTSSSPPPTPSGVRRCSVMGWNYMSSKLAAFAFLTDLGEL